MMTFCSAALGLHHEHQRPDRNQYFDLDCTRIAAQNGVAPVCSGVCQGWGCQFEPRTGGLGSTTMPELNRAGGSKHLVRCHIPTEERQRIWLEEVKPKLEA